VSDRRRPPARGGDSALLPDAVGDLGARRLGRWVAATLVAVLLLALAAGAVLARHGGAAAAPDVPEAAR
jgi:hypothetical protein